MYERRRTRQGPRCFVCCLPIPLFLGVACAAPLLLRLRSHRERNATAAPL
ncbi:MAG: hypothetical protein M3Q29_25295 [Chloroflexota bacterium]|nr:hypothetical protein [Chloroflexota bacterium]